MKARNTGGRGGRSNLQRRDGGAGEPVRPDAPAEVEPAAPAAGAAPAASVEGAAPPEARVSQLALPSVDTVFEARGVEGPASAQPVVEARGLDPVEPAALAPVVPVKHVRRPARIANASGFLGDRARAFEEMVTGGDIDFITGDYLAEVTMLILGRQRMKDSKAGYAKAFLRQIEPVLATILERGIKVVVNAGGLNPRGLADAVAALGQKLGVAPKVAIVEGDDLRGRLDELFAQGHTLTNLENGKSLQGLSAPIYTANAYLGAWGIVTALRGGADIVICPRVTDASLVVGPAAYWHDWSRDDWDALAGAVVAGHVIECGAQATGGNYSSFREIARPLHPGFPIAEVAADGSSVITKHEGTGGIVTVGTVTAQLVYEVGGTKYLNPDVTTSLDSVLLEQVGPDRVRASGTRGAPPPATTKVAITTAGGFANEMTFVFTGLDLDAKMTLFEQGARAELGLVKAHIDFQRIGGAILDSPHENQASAILRILATSNDEEAAGRAFSSALIELGLASYPGLFALAPPGPAHPVGRYWPALVPQSVLDHRVTLPDGTTVSIPLPPTMAEFAGVEGGDASTVPYSPTGPTSFVPLGDVVDARSGDKGSDANVGLWVRTDRAFEWLRGTLTVERFRELVPEVAPLAVTRTTLPNLRAVNFVIRGLLDGGAAATRRFDRQAKALGELVRSRHVDIPIGLIEDTEGDRVTKLVSVAPLPASSVPPRG